MRRMFKVGAIVATFFISGFISLPVSAANYTVIQYEQWASNISNQTLTKDKSPYLVLGGCMNSYKVANGYTFTIEAGVVVKFAPAGTCFGSGVKTRLGISGNFIVNGTIDEPVIFTSWNDDSASGDTNGDGNATQPHPGDWAGLDIENSGSSNININHAIIRYGGGGTFISELKIGLNVNLLQFSNLELAYSGSFGLSTKTSVTIKQGSFHHNPSGAIKADWPFTSAQVIATNSWWGDASGPTTPSNPDGKGQKFFGNVTYDPWIGKITKNDPVIIIPGILGSAEKDGVWLIDPIFHTYDDLIDTLAANGYVEGVDLFTLPYNWRQSNVLTAFQLHQKIDEVKTICGCDKVDLVGHSMGGLVARQYVQSNYYEGDVDHLIFLGTPHLGAPKDYLAWEGGNTGPEREDQLLKFILSREGKKLGYNNLFDYVRNNPVTSVQELLPIYNYIRDNGTGLMRDYPDNYPVNTFLENLDNTSSSLFSSGIKITNIIGDAGASSTINAFRVMPSTNLPLWANGYPEGFNEEIGDQGLEYGAGDATVSKNSAEDIKIDLNKISSSHRTIPDNGKGLIYKKLTNKDAITLVNKFYFPDIKLLIIKILSPADIVVIAPDGRKVGKDFTTGQEVNEVDGSFYSGFATDNEYVTILNPLDGEYRVQAQGTDNGGEYTIAAGYISGSSLSSQDFQASILPGMVSELKIDINSSTPEDLSVTPTDSVPPEITILSPRAQNYQRPFMLPIVAIAADTASGIYSQSLSFDGKIINSGDIVDLFYLPLGIHTVMATAADFMGNFAIITTTFKLTSSVSSTISDIERSYSLGWIADSGIKNSLIKKLQKIKKEGLRNFSNELDAQRGKYINEQAFLLIQEDVNWLLSN